MPKKTLINDGSVCITDVCCCGYRVVSSNNKKITTTAMRLHKKFCNPPKTREEIDRIQREAVEVIATKTKNEGHTTFEIKADMKKADLGTLQGLNKIAKDIDRK